MLPDHMLKSLGGLAASYYRKKLRPRSARELLSVHYYQRVMTNRITRWAIAKLDSESWKRIKKFYSIYAFQHKKRIIALFAGAILAGVIEIMGILFLYQLLHIMISGEMAWKGQFFQKLFGYFGLTGKPGFILGMGLLITATFIAKNIYILFYYQYQHLTLKKWKTEISVLFMQKYMHASYAFLLGYNSSTLIRNINSIVNTALNGFVLSTFNLAANIIVCLLIVSILYVKYLTVTLLVAGILVTSTLIQSVFLKNKYRALGAERDELLAYQAKNVYQGIHALKETKVIGRENYFLKTFQDINYKAVDNDSRSMLLARMPSHITEITIIIAIVAISAVVLLEHENDPAGSISSLGVLAAIAFRIAPLMNRTLGAIQGMHKNISSMDTMFAELEKLKHFEVYTSDREQIEALPFNNEITLDSVSFSYPNARTKAVRDVSLSIKAGAMIGVVGESGAGKTTLIDLLLGLMQPSEGQILIDGLALTKSNTKNWQKNLGYVPQAIYLHDDSILANVAFGLDKENIDVERVKETLKAVQLLKHVESLKGGIEYVVGENGKNLSGGQRQRLGIARALYLDAKVLILDEATAALDVPTENLVSQSISAFKGQKTIIVIAHRLSTIYEADQIVFMNAGRVEAVGSYSELFYSNEKFNHMARLAKILPKEELVKAAATQS